MKKITSNKTKKGKKETADNKLKQEIKKPALMYHPIRKNGKMLTGSIYNTSGFRICIYNGSKREEAILAKQDFIKTNSNHKNYI